MKVDIAEGIYRLIINTCGIESSELFIVDSETEVIKISSSVFGDRVPISTKWGGSEAENELADRINASSRFIKSNPSLNSSVFICVRTEKDVCLKLRKEDTSYSELLAEKDEINGRHCFLKELVSGMWILEINRASLSLCVFDGYQTQVFVDYSNDRITSLTILSSPNKEGFQPSREDVLALLILQIRMELYHFENDTWLDSICRHTENPLLAILMQHSMAYRAGKAAFDKLDLYTFNKIKQWPDVSCLINTSEMRKSPQECPPMLNRSADLIVKASVLENDWTLGETFVNSLPWRLRRFIWYVWCQYTETSSGENVRLNWLQNLLLDLMENGDDKQPKISLREFLNQQVLTVDNVIHAILDVSARKRFCIKSSRHRHLSSSLEIDDQYDIAPMLFSKFCRIWIDLPLLNSSEFADFLEGNEFATSNKQRATLLKMASENLPLQSALFKHKWPGISTTFEVASGSNLMSILERFIEQPVTNQPSVLKQQPSSELVHSTKSMIRTKTDLITGDSLGTGRRKTSVARVRLRPGSGKITVNGRAFEEYFVTEMERHLVTQTLEHVGHADKVDVFVRVAGGGPVSQAGAIRMGLARALVNLSERNFHPLRDDGFLTRDSRMKERKKYGRRGARRGTQFSKR
jgi:small subunit ribosomal protein S9